MKIGHSIGPWEATKAGVYAGEKCIAARMPQENAQWAANSRLIAAAPEMLVALQRLLGMLSDHEALDVVAAAIAKAKGGA